jgi:hypothetical protein
MQIEEEKGPDGGGRPSYRVSFAEKRLEDLRRLNKLERRDERPFAVVAEVSELGERAYLTLVRPWLRAWRSEPAAQLRRVFHPLRVQHWAWSGLNPLTWPVAALAENVKAARQPAAPENPFLALEQRGSELFSASWDLVRDLRDAAIESLFYLTYGGLMHLGIPATAGRESTPEPSEPRVLPQVRSVLEDLDQGGLVEAVARVGALMASRRGEFPLQRLEQAGALIRNDPVLSMLTQDEVRRVRTEQSTVVALEPERALETLPGLVADPEDRAHLIDLIEEAAAMVVLNDEQTAMLDRIHRVLAPAEAAARGNGWSRP